MDTKSKYSRLHADSAVCFVNCLKHTKGQWYGEPFKLIDWQEQIMRDIFGILKPNGYRQFNTAYIEIAKKQGKQLSLNTLIPTPNGFTTMGKIRVGDTIFDEKGNFCHVIDKSLLLIIVNKHIALLLKMVRLLKPEKDISGTENTLMEK